jgi:flagellar protein FliO/FliZ
MNAATGPSMMHLLQFLGSFALVVSLLLALAYGLKRLQSSKLFHRKSGTLELIETMPMAPRMKLALVRAGSREILLGITPGRISRIAQWRCEAGPTPTSATPQDSRPATGEQP